MKRAEVKAFITARLADGAARHEIFADLCQQGMKEKQAAFSLSFYPSAVRCAAARYKIIGIFVVLLLQTLIALPIMIEIGEDIGPIALWLVPASVLIVQSLLAWGIYRHHAGVYNVIIFYTAWGLWRALLPALFGREAFDIVSLLLGLAFIAYVSYVRKQVFPDVGFFGPKKEADGRYQFTD